MKRRRPTTAGIDQLSLNLSVTRSPVSSVLVSVLLWPLGALGGDIITGDLFFFVGCLEVARGMAQCGGLDLAALGGFCDGGSLLTTVRGTSVSGATGLIGAAGAVCVTAVGSGTIPGTAGSMLEAPLLAEPSSAVPMEARLLGGCVGVYPSLELGKVDGT